MVCKEKWGAMNMSEYVAGVMRMGAVGMWEIDKRRRWRHVRNAGLWDKNVGEERWDDINRVMSIAE